MTDLLRELNLEVTAEDLCKSPWSHRSMKMSENVADKVNAILRERVKGAVKVYDNDETFTTWSTDRRLGDTHSAYLLGVKKLEGE